MKNYKIAVAGTGYVGLSIATLLSQHHKVTAVDIVPEKVEMINNRKSPIQDDYIEKYLAEKDLNIEITDEVKDHLAENGYSEAYGARPLRRLIQRRMEDSLAEEILSGKYGPGDTIKVTLVDGKISFEKAAKKRAKKEKAEEGEQVTAE